MILGVGKPVFKTTPETGKTLKISPLKQGDFRKNSETGKTQKIFTPETGRLQKYF